MRNPVYGLLLVLALSLALCSCTSIDHQPQSAGNNSVKSDVQPADAGASVGTNKELSHRDLTEDKHLNVNLHVFGLSYHPDREGTRISHLDNEYNFGLGFGYKLHDDAQGVVISEAGFFRDSGRTWAKFAGMGYLFKLSDNWKLGADLLVIQSPTYNEGTAFAAPIPRLSYDFGPVKVNAIYIPRYKELNRFAVYGLYFTIPLLK
jgi:hypothetical protein